MRTRIPNIMLMLCLAGVSVASFAQSPASKPATFAFEAASFKLSGDQALNARRSENRDPGRVEFRGITLQGLLWEAYRAWYYQIVWPQDWKDARSVRYDIAATLPVGATKEHVPGMLQALMAERLNFKMHRESREMPVYALSIAKSGLRMKKATIDPNADPQKPPDFKIQNNGQEKRVQGELSMTYLLLALAGNLDRPLVDMTGLEGDYEIDLQFTSVPPRPTPLAGQETTSDYLSAAGSLISALEKQCGIRVEARKAPVEMLVIDHVDRAPSEN